MPITATLLRLRRSLVQLSERLGFLAPALIRVTAGAVFIQSGWGKLRNLAGTTEYFADLGIPLAGFNAVLASGTEFVGGILLLLGLAARLVSLPLAFTMLVAIITAQREAVTGLTALFGLDEWAYLVMFLVIALIGPGALSLDALIARRLERGAAARPGPTPDLSDPAPAGS